MVRPCRAFEAQGVLVMFARTPGSLDAVAYMTCIASGEAGSGPTGWPSAAWGKPESCSGASKASAEDGICLWDTVCAFALGLLDGDLCGEVSMRGPREGGEDRAPSTGHHVSI